MNFLEFKSYYQIKEHHLDTFGHVNNATYLQLFEQARWDIITEHGYSLEEIHKMKQGPVVLEVNVKFLKELRNRENITIVSQGREFSGKVGTMLQKIEKENSEVACEGLFKFGFFDHKSRRLIDPPESWLRAIGQK